MLDSTVVTNTNQTQTTSIKKMKIIIDILHPAHVHFFKNFILDMQQDGHEILVTTRSKDITTNLLDQYKIPYTKISDSKIGLVGMATELISRTRKFIKIAKEFKPDVLMGEHGTTIAIAGKLLKVPSLVYWDTEVAKLVNTITYPLATTVYTPTSYTGKVHGHHVTYKGYQKLAYLHPNQFTPNKDILKKYNITQEKDQKNGFVLIRFVAFKYNHDKDCIGIKNKIDFVQEIAKHQKVYISSESPLPEELKPYELKIDVTDIFDIMSQASLYIGESPTMATEAALLGVPSVYISNSPRGYITELHEKYKLVIWAQTERDGLKESINILTNKESKTTWQKRKETMLKDMIDVTEWMKETVKNKDWKKK